MKQNHFKSPEAALLNPRETVAWMVTFRRFLGLPAPDPFWRTTAQVNWCGYNGVHPRFATRVACLYFGHDMQERKVREAGTGIGPTHRRDCVRCGWEGPWTDTYAPSATPVDPFSSLRPSLEDS